MTALEIFKAAARRWQLLLVFVVLGATAAFVIGPPKELAPEVTYEATHTVGPLPNDPTLTASRLALLVSHPDVVGPVAEAFGYPDNFSLLDQVAIVPNDTTLTLGLTTRQSTPAMAVGIADGLANGLIELLKAEDRAAQEVQLAEVQAELVELRAELQDLAAQGGIESPDPAIQSQAQGVQALLGQKLGEERALSQEPDPRVRTVIAATPHAIEVGGFSTPLNRPAMTLIGLVFGLGLGVALAVMFNHLDSRVRTVADVVESFNIPVIGQVPTAPRSSRRVRDRHLRGTELRPLRGPPEHPDSGSRPWPTASISSAPSPTGVMPRSGRTGTSGRAGSSSSRPPASATASRPRSPTWPPPSPTRVAASSWSAATFGAPPSTDTSTSPTTQRVSVTTWAT